MEEGIRFSELSISDALRECLNLSSLSLDLAYAAVIYEDVEIAREAIDESIYLDKLVEAIIMRYGLATKDIDDAKNFLPFIRAAYMMDQVSDGSQRIAEIVLAGKKFLPEVKVAFMKGEEAVGLMKIDEKSKLNKLSYEEALIKLGVGFDIIAVKRGEEWIINPKGRFRFRVGDIVVIRGTEEVLEFFEIPLKFERGAVNEEIVDYMRRIKNYSELSLYLAYSSMLYDSKGLASGSIQYKRELVDLKRKLIEKLLEEGNRIEVINTIELLNILEYISSAGEKLALTVRGERRVNPLLDIIDDESKEQFVLIKVKEKSIWNNKTVGELSLEDRIGVKIIALKRRGKWIFELSDNFRIIQGDLILLEGYKSGIKILEEMGEEVKVEE